MGWQKSHGPSEVLGEVEKSSVFLRESTIWPCWDSTSCGCWHREATLADAQQQSLAAVAGGGEEREKLSSATIRYFMSLH